MSQIIVENFFVSRSQSAEKGFLENVKNVIGKSRARKRKLKKDLAHETPKKTKTRSSKQFGKTSDKLEIIPLKYVFNSLEMISNPFSDDEKNESNRSIFPINDELSMGENNYKNTKFIILDDLEDTNYKEHSDHSKLKLHPSRAKKVATPSKKIIKSKLRRSKPRSLHTSNKTSRKENNFKRQKKALQTTKIKANSNPGSEDKLNIKENKKIDIHVIKEKSLKDVTRNEEESDSNNENEIENCWETSSQNISKTCINVYLPITNSGISQASHDEESIIDENFIRSLLEITKSNQEDDPVNKKSVKCNKRTAEKKPNFSQMNEGKSTNKSKKHKKSNKRLHQTQKVFFSAKSDNEKTLERISQEWIKRDFQFDKEDKLSKLSDKADFQFVKNCKLKRSASQRAGGIETNLTKIKSEKIKGYINMNVSDNGVKDKLQNLKEKEVDFIEIPFNDEGSKVTELWRNDVTASSEHSVLSMSSSGTEMNDPTDTHEYLGIKSYRTLQKFVEDEVQRIYKGQKIKEKKVAHGDNIEKNQVHNPELCNDNKVNEKESEFKTETKTKRLTLSESKKMEKKLSKKLRMPNSPQRIIREYLPENYYEKLYPKVDNELDLPQKNLLRTESEKNSILAKNEEKKDEMENKLLLKKKNIIEEKKSNEKFPSEIIKNWSLLTRLEKAFFALGTPDFSNKSFGNCTTLFLKNKEKEKDYATEKSLIQKIKGSDVNYSEHKINNQLPPPNLSKLKTKNYELYKGRSVNENTEKMDSKLKMSV